MYPPCCCRVDLHVRLEGWAALWPLCRRPPSSMGTGIRAKQGFSYPMSKTWLEVLLGLTLSPVSMPKCQLLGIYQFPDRLLERKNRSVFLCEEHTKDMSAGLVAKGYALINPSGKEDQSNHPSYVLVKQKKKSAAKTKCSVNDCKNSGTHLWQDQKIRRIHSFFVALAPETSFQ